MVAGAETADLVQSPVDGAAADLREIGVADRAVILAPVEVTLAAVALADGVGGPAEQQLVHLRPAGQPPDTATAGTARDRGREPVHDLAKNRSELVPAELGREQANRCQARSRCAIRPSSPRASAGRSRSSATSYSNGTRCAGACPAATACVTIPRVCRR